MYQLIKIICTYYNIILLGLCMQFDDVMPCAIGGQEIVEQYGTARFKLEARVRVTRVYFVAPLEYFSNSCVSVDNCMRISRAIHARMTSPNMLTYVRMCMDAHYNPRTFTKEFRSPPVTLFSVQAHETTILTCMFVKLTCTV